MYSQQKGEWKGGRRRPAWVQRASTAVWFAILPPCISVSDEYRDETRIWYWPHLVVTERWHFLSAEGKLGPSQNLHIHHDYCCHLLCSLMSSNINRSPSVCSVDVYKYIQPPDTLPHCVKGASHFSFREVSNPSNVTWWSPPPIRLHWVNYGLPPKCHPE